MLFLFFVDAPSPVRLPHNNLHRYSKVLKQQGSNEKLPAPKCPVLEWAPRYPINVTSTVILNQKETKFDDLESNANLLRKLESEKGKYNLSYKKNGT